MGKSNKIVMAVIIVLLVILLVAVAGLSFFALRTLNELKGEVEGEGEHTEVPSPIVILTQDQLTSVALDEIMVNLQSGIDNKSHMIQIQISVVIDNSTKKSAEFVKLAEEKKDVFYDALIYVCNNTTRDELLADGGWDVFKDDLVREFRAKFDSELIYGINFVKKIIA